MGGRGAKSSYGDEGITTGDSGRPLTFYDLTDKYKGMTIQEFEKAIRDRKVEYIGLADKNGKIIIAGSSNNEGAVAVPTTHPDFNKAKTLTHNHPYYGGRELGGSFSGADVKNHVTLGLDSSRATSKEKTYIIRQGTTTKEQRKSMYSKASKSDSQWSKEVNTRINRLVSNGKQMSKETTARVRYGYGTRLWKNLARNSGYEYIEIKPKNR